MANLVRLNNFGFSGVVIERTNDIPLPVPIGTTEIIVDIDDPLVRASLHKFRGKLSIMGINLTLRLKYTLASASRVHMDADLDFLVGNNLLLALPDDATQLQLVQHLNAIKLAIVDHANSAVTLDEGGHPTADGSHQAADIDELSTMDGLTNLDEESLPNDSDTYDFIVALFNANSAHYSATNGDLDVKVHFHDDENLTDMIPPLHGPNLAYNIDQANNLRTLLMLHMARAAV